MKILKKLTALMMAAVLALSFAACSADGVSGQTDGAPSVLEQSINSAGKYLVKKVWKPTYGNEKMIIGLVRSGYIDFWHNRPTVYESAMNKMLSDNAGVLGKKNEIYADGYPEVILAFTATGKYADRTANANLISGVSYDNIVMQGGYLNKINALTALECADYAVDQNGDVTREALAEFILGLQREDGSFQYSGMSESPIKITAAAVTALAMTESTPQISRALEKGTAYLITHIRKDDSLAELSDTVIALNTAGISAADVEGNSLVEWIMSYQKEDGSFAQDTSAAKGNVNDTQDALMGLASQYRFETGLSPIYEMSDIAGGTHNKLSPGWTLYVNMMKVFLVIVVVFLAVLLVVSRIRIKKWKAAGIYNEQAGRMMTDAEIAEKKAREAARQTEPSEENVTESETPAEEKADENRTPALDNAQDGTQRSEDAPKTEN